MVAVIIILVILLVICAFVKVKMNEQKHQENQERIKEKKKRQEAIFSTQKEKYGEPEHVVMMGSYEHSLIAFSEAKQLYYNLDYYPYESLSSCSLEVESYSKIIGKQTSVSKSDTGSLLGRAVVGNMIAGPTGAIIGGVTGKKTTTTSNNLRTVTMHNYYVHVKTSDSKHPSFTIDCSFLGREKAEEVERIINDIISRNVQTDKETETSSPLGHTSLAEEIKELVALKEQGVLSDKEFDDAKAKLLSNNH